MCAVEPDFGALGEQRGQRPRTKALHPPGPEGIRDAARYLRIIRPRIGGEAQHRDRQSGVAHLVRSRHARAQQRRDRAQFRGPAEGGALGLDRPADRTSVVEGKTVTVRLEPGVRRIIKKKTHLLISYMTYK